MGELGFDLPFEHTGLDEAGHAAEPGPGNLAGLANEGHFRLGFDRPQLVHERGQPAEIMQGITPQCVANEARIPGLDFD